MSLGLEMGHNSITDSYFTDFYSHVPDCPYDILLITSRRPILKEDHIASITLILSWSVRLILCLSLRPVLCIKNLEGTFSLPLMSSHHWVPFFPPMTCPPLLPFPVTSAPSALRGVAQFLRGWCSPCSLQPHLASCRNERMFLILLYVSIMPGHQNRITFDPVI